MKRDAVQGETVRGRGLSGVRIIALAIVGIAVVWVGVFGLVRAIRFIEDDPRLCGSCHTMSEALDQWRSGEHEGVSCHSCHEADMAASLQQVWRYVTRQPDGVRARADVPAATCLNCHRLQEGAGSPVSTNMHHAAGERADCPICHGQELHHFETPPWSDICASCH